MIAAFAALVVAVFGPGNTAAPRPTLPPPIEAVKAERDFWNAAAKKRRREAKALARALAEARAEIRRLNAPPTTIVGLGLLMASRGYHVSEHPDFGGVAPVHSGGSLHYSALAVDVNCDGCPGGEEAALDKLAADLRTLPGVTELLWRVPDHFDHLHVGMAA